MREFLKGLDLDKELIDAIMAEHGKYLTGLKEQVDEYKKEVEGYKSTIDDLTSKATANENTQKELDELKKQVADRTLNEKILEAIGDKKFVNDYTKNAIISEIKKSLDDESNKGKSINDLLEITTEGKDGIFVNPNQIVDMPPIDENVENVVSKADFEKMGYKERLELKASNPELFNKYNNM